MILRINLPTGIFVDQEVSSVVAESPRGSFCLMPRHVDMASILAPGLFCYRADGMESYLAIDRGVLVKQGRDVHVAARSAVAGELGFLEGEVRRMHEEMDEQERSTRSAVARLEANFVRRFMEYGRS
ncbi:MAG: F0F1 ATP synthase subunit epsilon [Pseudodesulfovibrio sp.]|nr:F0F1 ATP synthase subunit epsilon [Pseudodesulfovibrio sp.]